MSCADFKQWHILIDFVLNCAAMGIGYWLRGKR